MQAKPFPQKSVDWRVHLEREEEVDVPNDPHLPFASGERCRARRKPVVMWIASGFCSRTLACCRVGLYSWVMDLQLGSLLSQVCSSTCGSQLMRGLRSGSAFWWMQDGVVHTATRVACIYFFFTLFRTFLRRTQVSCPGLFSWLPAPTEHDFTPAGFVLLHMLYHLGVPPALPPVRAAFSRCM